MPYHLGRQARERLHSQQADDDRLAWEQNSHGTKIGSCNMKGLK